MCTVFCEVHMFTHKKSRYCDLLSGNSLLDKLQAMTHQKAYAQNLNIFKNISFSNDVLLHFIQLQNITA